MKTPGTSLLARRAMAYVLAGGRGSRLMELTAWRAKPAVYFGGKSRIVDFALSNAFNSGIRHIAVATQYKAHSLIHHLVRGWSFLRPIASESFDILPASQRVSEECWYLGTADAVYQNIDIVEAQSPEFMVILAGDHVYKMDYEIMLRQHVDKNADVTVACIEVPRETATGFGVMHIDESDGIISFLEKPADPPAMPGKPNCRSPAWASMCSGRNSCSTSSAAMPQTPPRRTISARILSLISWPTGAPLRTSFERSCVRSAAETGGYWRDVGTVDAYWEANIDLTDVVPDLDIYDEDWPIWTYSPITPPAKFVHDEDGRRGMAISSLVSGACVVSGAFIRHTLLSTGTRVNSYAMVENAVILPQVNVGRSARLKNVVVDRQGENP